MTEITKIEQKAECNGLLGKSDNLAVYTVLYYGLSDNKRYTIREIISEVSRKFSMDITANKVNYILKPFVEKDIVRKNIKNGTHKYYLNKRIYTPSQNTPIPLYQFGLLIFGFLLMFISFVFADNTTANWMSLTFFGTLLLVVIVHQFLFEYKG